MTTINSEKMTQSHEKIIETKTFTLPVPNDVNLDLYFPDKACQLGAKPFVVGLARASGIWTTHRNANTINLSS